MSSIFVSNGHQAVDKDILCLKSNIIAMDTGLNTVVCDVQRQVLAIYMGETKIRRMGKHSGSLEVRFHEFKIVCVSELRNRLTSDFDPICSLMGNVE
jgi:hypothetical protein